MEFRDENYIYFNFLKNDLNFIGIVLGDSTCVP